MENKVIAYCNGGLGNRFFGLVGAMALAERIGRDYAINWKENNWCGCSFKDLFDTDKEIIEKTKKELGESYSYFSVCHMPIEPTHPEKNAHPNAIMIVDFKSIPEKTIIYTHDNIPCFFSDRVTSNLRALKLNRKIAEELRKFCFDNGIDKSVSGIHLRRTDADTPNRKQGYTDNGLVDYIQRRPAERFFICSDDRDTELNFRHLPNATIREKPAYVQKLSPGDWNRTITDDEGAVWPFNVDRTRQSSIEGFLDMLILSRTRIVTPADGGYMSLTINGGSSFLKFAEYFGQITMEELCR